MNWKDMAWFAAGMATGEFVLRWFIHAAYLGVIAVLLLRLYARI